MYQMLTNISSNSTPPQPIPSLRIRSLTDHQTPIINHSKPLKRLGHHKRQRLVKTNPISTTSELLLSFHLYP